MASTGLLQLDGNGTGIKEENQDLGLVEQDRGVKEENQEENRHPDLTERNSYRDEMKQESQDPDFKQVQLESGTKKEIHDPDRIDCDYYKVEIKEEDEDPGFDKEEQNHNQDRDQDELPGPSDQQVSADPQKRDITGPKRFHYFTNLHTE